MRILPHRTWSFIESSDIVCISTITSTAIKAYRMGKRVRALYIPVIMGGAHPTFLPDEAMDYADFVIRGEGENALVELLEHMDKGFPNLERHQRTFLQGSGRENCPQPCRTIFLKTSTAFPRPISPLSMTGPRRIPILSPH